MSKRPASFAGFFFLSGSVLLAQTVTLTSVAPNSGTQGSSVPVTLAGTNFMAGSTVVVSGSGVTAGSLVVGSATQITATLTIAANAAPGPRTVTVTRGTESASSPN